jgi:hypothetical protein
VATSVVNMSGTSFNLWSDGVVTVEGVAIGGRVGRRILPLVVSLVWACCGRLEGRTV